MLHASTQGLNICWYDMKSIHKMFFIYVRDMTLGERFQNSSGWHRHKLDWSVFLGDGLSHKTSLPSVSQGSNTVTHQPQQTQEKTWDMHTPVDEVWYMVI